MLYRSLALLCLLVTLGGCGFQSLYGKADEFVLQNLESIKVETINDRKGQILRNRLLTLLTPKGTPQKPLYSLQVTLKIQEQNIGVLRDATASRVERIITATYSIKNTKNNKTLFASKATATGAYNILTGADYSTIVSKKKAETLAFDQIAQQIQSQLACYFETVKR